jgi:hypothetical protein
MLLDLWNQYCENGYIAKSSLYVQCNSHQNSNDTHHKHWIINPKVHLEAQETTNIQGKTEQKEQRWR